MKKLFLLLLMVATVGVAMAQTRTISGTVTYSGDGEPLLGATVMPIGGGQGVSTDIDGKFSITVPASVKKIRVSYVGMATKEVPAGTNLSIVLENSDKSLDEVMVVAYGAVKKSAFTGSASVVDASTIENATVSNALSALTGNVPGVQISTQSGQPGNGPSTIRIRGISSITAGKDPLYVVDGAPFAGDMNQINPNDIASMTVLKDAAATALYGARGANGVILVTTKKGQSSGGVVTLDAKWGWNTRATQDYNTIDDPRMYYETYYKSLYNYMTYDGTMSPSEANVWANNNLVNGTFGLGYPIFNYPQGELLIGMNGKINPNATYGNVINYKGQSFYIRPDNWLDETYKSSLRQEYNVSVSNQNERTTFYASAGWLKNEGIIVNSSFERFSGRLAADTQVKPWLKVGADVNYTHFDSNSMSGDGSSSSTVNPLAFATSIAPIYPMYMRDGNGNIMKNADGLTMYDFGDGSNAGLSRPSFPGANGLSAASYNTSNTEGNTVRGMGYAEVRFLKDFKFTTKNSVYLQEYRGTSVGNPYFGGSAPQGGSVSKSHRRYMEWSYQQILEWSHLFGKHDVNIMAGHESNWQKSFYLAADKTQMFSPDNKELAGAVITGTMDSYTASYNNEGWIVRAMYNFDEKYFLDGYYRRDGSSRFHPDHRWGNFWAASGAWVLSKEEWFNNNLFNFFKIKASYGELGNDNISAYAYTNNYSIVNNNDQPAVIASSVQGNPNITWEKLGSFNAGVEFEMFNGRLSANLEGFWRKTTDMLYQKALPVTQGFTNKWMNLGDMVNAGLEADFQGTLVQTRDFTWDMNLNLTYVKNKIVRLAPESKNAIKNGHEGYASGGYYYGEGLPMYTFYCLDYAGVDPETGEALYYKNVYARDENDKIIYDAKGEAVVDHRDKVPLTKTPTQYLNGTSLAPVYGGFGTSLRLKGFDLSVHFAYQIGGQVMDSNYKSLMMSPTANSIGNAVHADVLNSWTPENPNSNIPRWCFGDEDNQTSNRFLTSASYLSLQNVNLGYSLPAALLRKIQIQKLRVYVAAENLWLWSARQGLDPRQSVTGSTTNAYYSPIRTVSAGLTVTF